MAQKFGSGKSLGVDLPKKIGVRIGVDLCPNAGSTPQKEVVANGVLVCANTVQVVAN